MPTVDDLLAQAEAELADTLGTLQRQKVRVEILREVAALTSDAPPAPTTAPPVVCRPRLAAQPAAQVAVRYGGLSHQVHSVLSHRGPLRVKTIAQRMGRPSNQISKILSDGRMKLFERTSEAKFAPWQAIPGVLSLLPDPTPEPVPQRLPPGPQPAPRGTSRPIPPDARPTPTEPAGWFTVREDPTGRRYRRTGLTWRIHRVLFADPFPLSARDLGRQLQATTTNVQTALENGEGIWFERDEERQRLWKALFVETTPALSRSTS